MLGALNQSLGSEIVGEYQRGRMQIEHTPEVLLRITQPIAARTILAVMLLAGTCAFALNPSLDVSQYGHTAWRVSDGFTQGTILTIAQTPDGYLWLGTEFGLYRFDGVRVVPWRPPPGEDLPSRNVYHLLAGRDGTLWIGTAKGVAAWKDGKLTRYPELDGQMIYSLLEDHEGTIWSSSEVFFSHATLCAIGRTGVHCYGKDGSLGEGWIVSLYEDRKGNLWANGKNGIWRWKPGPPKFYPLPIGPDYLDGIAEDDAGKLLIGMEGGIRRFLDGKIEAYSLPGRVPPFSTRTLLRDRDGGIWIAAYHAGLVHVHQGRVDVFRQADGLSNDEVVALFEDRENNLWVSTNNGLDRFRDTAVATFSLNEGLSNALPRSVLGDKDGSVLIATPGGLDRWREGQITTYNQRDGKLNGLPPASLFEDSSGRIWVSTTREFGYLEGNQFVSVSSTYDGRMQDFAEDSAGNLWIADQQRGLLHVSGNKLVERIPWASLGHKDFALSLAADHLRGGLWLGFFGGGISYFADGHIQETYTAADRLGNGSVTSLQVEKDGTLWAATDGGLSRMKNRHFITLARENGLPCNPIHWMIQDDDHSFWLYTPCGLVRLARSEMDSWAAAADRNQAGKQMLHPTVFDSTDGVRVHEISYHAYNPPVTKSLDGKIWFLPEDGVSVIDPHHLPLNRLPPPVHIEQITANGNSLAAVSHGKGEIRLPPRVRVLTINYTALSLVVPEKLRFRFKLEGQDDDWREVVNDRKVEYSNLAPGHYRFRVTACNNSAVWNTEGDSLDFSIAPAYYQTTWFRLLFVAVFLALLWILYQLRLQQLRRQFNVGLEARVQERTRIARDLHDTLLQTFHGVLFRFQAVSDLLPEGAAKERLDSAIDQAAQAITEGRDAVQDIRSSTEVSNNLSQAIGALGQELVAIDATHHPAAFRIEVEGTPRDLHPILRDEVYRIAGEALRNAFRHAQAQQIEVEIRYEQRQFQLIVRDDGKGLDPTVLNNEVRPGHWGLHGMRERAKLIGGELEVWSKLESGTEIELTIPATRAYSASRSPLWSWLFRDRTVTKP